MESESSLQPFDLTALIGVRIRISMSFRLRFRFFVTIMILFTVHTEAQEKKPEREPLVMRFAGESRSLSLNLSDQTPEGLIPVSYEPNTPFLAGLGLNYGDFGFMVDFKVPGIDKDTSRYGTTRAQDLQGYYYAERVGVDLFYQNYSGFYADYPNGKTDNSIADIRSDLRVTNLGTNVYFSLTDSFSLKPAFRQAGWQDGFHLGFLLGASANAFMVSSSTTIIPATLEARFPQYTGYRGGQYLNLSVMPGLGLSYADKGAFFITVILMLGGGATHATIDVNAGSSTTVTDNFKGNAKINLGARTESLVVGIAMIADFTGVSAFSGSTFQLGAGLALFNVYASYAIY